MGDPATDGERHRKHLAAVPRREHPRAAAGRAGRERSARAEGRERRDRRRGERERRAVEYVVFPDEGHGFTKRENSITASNAYRDVPGQVPEAGSGVSRMEAVGGWRLAVSAEAFMRNLLSAISILLFSHVHAECDLTAAQAPRDDTCARAWMDENLHANDLLSIGTHNSYKAAIPDAELAQLRARSTRRRDRARLLASPLTEAARCMARASWSSTSITIRRAVASPIRSGPRTLGPACRRCTCR